MDDKLNKMLFEEECTNLEKALQESENNRIKRAEHEQAVSVVLLLGPSYDWDRAREIIKRVI